MKMDLILTGDKVNKYSVIQNNYYDFKDHIDYSDNEKFKTEYDKIKIELSEYKKKILNEQIKLATDYAISCIPYNIAETIMDGYTLREGQLQTMLSNFLDSSNLKHLNEEIYYQELEKELLKVGKEKGFNVVFYNKDVDFCGVGAPSCTRNKRFVKMTPLEKIKRNNSSKIKRLLEIIERNNIIIENAKSSARYLFDKLLDLQTEQTEQKEKNEKIQERKNLSRDLAENNQKIDLYLKENSELKKQIENLKIEEL